MRRYTWRGALRALAVLVNLVFLGYLVPAMALPPQDSFYLDSQAMRRELIQRGLILAVPVISLVALLWPPVKKAKQ